MKYQVIQTNDVDLLEERVAACIEAGYEPLGGVCVVCNTWHSEQNDEDRSDFYYYQAMISR